MRTLRIWLMAIAATLVALPAAAYGPKGHQIIGAIADARLSPAARAAVARNLGMPLRIAATWADCVKDVAKIGDEFIHQPDARYTASCQVFATTAGVNRMIDYVRRNGDSCGEPMMTSGCHALYHFTDVAIQQGHYDRAFTGTSDHDIVSAIGAVIAKLGGFKTEAQHPSY